MSTTVSTLKMESQVKLLKKPETPQTKEALMSFTKEELVERVLRLQAHTEQLKNLLKPKESQSRKKRSFDFKKCHYRRVALHVYYLGWKFDGYATQEESGNTVEDHIFTALVKTCLVKDRASSGYHRCGRTDKGVSSFGQVISLTIRSKLNLEDQSNLSQELDYCKMLNQVLPSELQCVAWSPIGDDFSARFNCINRTYKYLFPLGSLNVERMKEACQKLIGTHDFRNLCKMDVAHGVVNFTRTIDDVRIDTVNEVDSEKKNSYDMFTVTITSRGFLWHQIRCIMGVLFLIGDEKEPVELIDHLLDVERTPRRPQYYMAHFLPLNLYKCEYVDSLNWQISSENVKYLTKRLKSQWAEEAVKAETIKLMIKGLHFLRNDDVGQMMSQTDFLIQGANSRVYVPVLKRPTCESLENRVKHFVKRKKLQVVDDDGDGAS